MVVKRYVRVVEMLKAVLVSNIGRICWAGKRLYTLSLGGLSCVVQKVFGMEEGKSHFG